jgi:hypothetical protein
MNVCFDCMFYCDEMGKRADEFTGRASVGGPAGECRRLSPRPGRHLPGEHLRDFADWPRVFETDWCGQFQPCNRKKAKTMRLHI